MRVRGHAMLTSLALLCSGVGLALPAMGQQDGSVHPITSLPKAPGDEATVVSAPVPQADAPVMVQSLPAPTPSAASAAPAMAYPPPPPKRDSSSSSESFVPMGGAVQQYTLPVPRSLARPSPAENYTTSEHIGPFSTIAVGVKGGFAGFGLDMATPIARNFNARVGATFYSYSGSYNVDGVTINGEAKFRAATVNLDYFPWWRSQFRLSVGLNLYNGNNLNATSTVPGGVEFDLGDAEYYSSPTDPIHGTASMTFGNRVAPTLTIGVGNMIPRDGGRFSFPFEIGVEFNVKPPMLGMYLMGSACMSDPTQPGFDPTTCGPVEMDQTDIQQEENQVNSDIRFLRFYPIISQGVAVRF